MGRKNVHAGRPASPPLDARAFLHLPLLFARQGLLGGTGLNFAQQKEPGEAAEEEEAEERGRRGGQRREKGKRCKVKQGIRRCGRMKEEVGQRSDAQKPREPPRDEVRVPGPENRSPRGRGKRAGSDPRGRRLPLLLPRVGGQRGWVPPCGGPRRAQGCSVSPLPPTRLPGPRPLCSSAAAAAFLLQPPPPPPPPPQPPVCRPPRPDSPPLSLSQAGESGASGGHAQPAAEAPPPPHSHRLPQPIHAHLSAPASNREPGSFRRACRSANSSEGWAS